MRAYRMREKPPITVDTPLRVVVVAEMVFGKDGDMTAQGLRREVARGCLVIERIANKVFNAGRYRWHAEAMPHGS
jgi:hypothetical protein